MNKIYQNTSFKEEYNLRYIVGNTFEVSNLEPIKYKDTDEVLFPAGKIYFIVEITEVNISSFKVKIKEYGIKSGAYTSDKRDFSLKVFYDIKAQAQVTSSLDFTRIPFTGGSRTNLPIYTGFGILEPFSITIKVGLLYNDENTFLKLDTSVYKYHLGNGIIGRISGIHFNGNECEAKLNGEIII